MGKYDESVYRILSDLVTPNKVAKLAATQKTAFSSYKRKREIQELRPDPHLLEGKGERQLTLGKSETKRRSIRKALEQAGLSPIVFYARELRLLQNANARGDSPKNEFCNKFCSAIFCETMLISTFSTSCGCRTGLQGLL